MNTDIVLQDSAAIRLHIRNLIKLTKEENHIDYFTIVKFDTAEPNEINCLIMISVETVKDKYPIGLRTEVNQVALDSFQDSIKEFAQENTKRGITYRIAALLP